MRSIVKVASAPTALAILALLLAVGAWKLSAGGGSVRNAFPDAEAATELPATAPQTAVENRLLSDQMQLGSDLRSTAPGNTAESSAVHDTEKLISDVSASSISRANRADELRQAVDVVRLHTCTECLRLLKVAASGP